MMFASVIQWKKHHPTYICELHADKRTIKLFKKLGTDKLWDNIQVVGKNKAINKSVFWASAKLQALRQVTEPVIVMDNDFIVYSSFEKFINKQPIVCHDEEGKNYYLGPLDPYIKQVKHLINRPQLKAVNCSFLYLPDYKFTQHYAKSSLELMEEFTRIKAPNSKYLIYAEQLLLKHLFTLHNIPYETLLDTVYDSHINKFTTKVKGHISESSHRKYFRHYWMEKPKIRESEDGFDYDQEIQQLDNVVKNHILINWNKLC